MPVGLDFLDKRLESLMPKNLNNEVDIVRDNGLPTGAMLGKEH